MLNKSRFVLFTFLLFFSNLSVEANTNISTHYDYSPSKNINGFATPSESDAKGGHYLVKSVCPANDVYSNHFGFKITNYNTGGGSNDHYVSGKLNGSVELDLKRLGTNDTLRVRLHPYILDIDHYLRSDTIPKGDGETGTFCHLYWSNWRNKGHLSGFTLTRTINTSGTYTSAGAYFRRSRDSDHVHAAIALQIIDQSTVIKPGRYTGSVLGTNAIQTSRISSATQFTQLENSNITVALDVDRAFVFNFFDNAVSINPNYGNSNSKRIHFSTNVNVPTYVTVSCLHKTLDNTGFSCFIDPEKKLRLSVAIGFQSSGNVQPLKFGVKEDITKLMKGVGARYDLGYFNFTIDGFNDAVPGRAYSTSINVLFEEKF